MPFAKLLHPKKALATVLIASADHRKAHTFAPSLRRFLPACISPFDRSVDT
jgi:hypothetical protein